MVLHLGKETVLWSPGKWTLKQRQQRETFTAVVDGVPDSLRKQYLPVQDYDSQDPFFKDFDFKSYEIIKFGGRNRLIAYFETYEQMKTALESSFHLDGQDYRWTRPTSSSPKKKSGRQGLPQTQPKARRVPRNDQAAMRKARIR
ncbi:hypothetical protein RclHR1_00590005 [Rhizophagus clarus]|uniref:Uncharacterized protein n=1 Tax=Rhizophagus clarus TaxID=94130 RepID=A0A2Z6SH77_9GLOM|nr:hypothetical protein RclHR1_00590005 [Rhizophagus clarus]GES92465.1 hypothetical protein GLOIN_2v1773466 [Rhizophagus clarus]